MQHRENQFTGKNTKSLNQESKKGLSLKYEHCNRSIKNIHKERMQLCANNLNCYVFDYLYVRHRSISIQVQEKGLTKGFYIHTLWPPPPPTYLPTDLNSTQNETNLQIINIRISIIYSFIRQISLSVFNQVFHSGNSQHKNQRYHGNLFPECINLRNKVQDNYEKEI